MSEIKGCPRKIIGWYMGEPHYGEHQHTIPVEWEYKGVTDSATFFAPTGKRVKTLRCVCGDEVER